MKHVLLVTERYDPTADLIIAELRRRELPCVRWNLDQFPVGSVLSYAASNERFAAHIIVDGRRLDLADVASIWWRGFQPTGLPDTVLGEQRKFAIMESRLALMALMRVGNFLWINHPEHERIADFKPAQLCVAREVGFDIPPTIITNNPDDVREFLKHLQNPAIYKTLSQPINMEPGKVVFTGKLTEKELSKLEAIRLSPGIFQAHVAKAYEVRTTVVGSRIFSAKINSQSEARTSTDWRRAPFDVSYDVIDLPSDIEETIHAFMTSFRIVYGAFDFIVTPEGRYVFLEVNPAGQYMWIESATGLEITSALADKLGEPCRT